MLVGSRSRGVSIAGSKLCQPDSCHRGRHWALRARSSTKVSLLLAQILSRKPMIEVPSRSGAPCQIRARRGEFSRAPRSTKVLFRGPPLGVCTRVAPRRHPSMAPTILAGAGGARRRPVPHLLGGRRRLVAGRGGGGAAMRASGLRGLRRGLLGRPRELRPCGRGGPLLPDASVQALCLELRRCSCV